MTGNACTGQSFSYDRGVVGNTQTGNKAAWNNGNLYTDRDGNVSNGGPAKQKNHLRKLHLDHATEGCPLPRNCQARSRRVQSPVD